MSSTAWKQTKTFHGRDISSAAVTESERSCSYVRKRYEKQVCALGHIRRAGRFQSLQRHCLRRCAV